MPAVSGLFEFLPDDSCDAVIDVEFLAGHAILATLRDAQAVAGPFVGVLGNHAS